MVIIFFYNLRVFQSYIIVKLELTSISSVT